MYEYAIDSREWSLVATSGAIPSPRTFHQMCAIDNRLYVVGGGSTSEKLRDIYYLPIYNLSDVDNSETISLAFREEDDSVSQQSIDDRVQKTLKESVMLLKKQVEEISTRLKELKESSVCIICCDQKINCVILNCGHKTCCFRCIENFKDCPVCRGAIHKIIKIA